jgi:hypothetical protein
MRKGLDDWFGQDDQEASGEVNSDPTGMGLTARENSLRSAIEVSWERVFDELILPRDRWLNGVDR